MQAQIQQILAEFETQASRVLPQNMVQEASNVLAKVLDEKLGPSGAEPDTVHWIESGRSGATKENRTC